MMTGLRRALAPLENRVRLMIGRGVIAAVDDGPKVQELRVDLLEDESHDGIEHFQHYGFTSNPPAESEALVAFVGGLRSHGVAIAVGDRQYRLRGLSTGDVALYDDQGQSVWLGRDGILINGKALTVECEGDIRLSGSACTIAADRIDLASDNISVGNGAMLGAARQTDAVTGAMISGGSSKVKIA